MREIFTYGSVGRASGNRCLYPEGRPGELAAFRKTLVFETNLILGKSLVLISGRLSSPLWCDTKSHYWLFGGPVGPDQTRHSPAGTLGGMRLPVHPATV